MIKKLVACLALASVLTAPVAFADSKKDKDAKAKGNDKKEASVQLGPRPFFLIDQMEDGALKAKLQSCSTGPFEKTDFSIGHRGAALQFPEHTKESYDAAAKMGAGIIECDVAATQDGELVCRHDQCDLHATTNILDFPALANRCDGGICCTSDFTLAEIKGLCGKMENLNNSPTWRTQLYSTCGTIMSHKESIELIKGHGSKFTPELKEVKFLPAGMSYDDVRQKMIDEYKQANIPPSNVWAQSFVLDDVLYWINNEPAFGHQAVFLDALVDSDFNAAKAQARLDGLADQGVKIIAPPMWALVTVDGGKIVPSEYAQNAKTAGLDIITWTLERSGPLATGGGYYYQSIAGVTDNDGDMMVLLDVLAKEVGVLGIFSDWPATVTYYANCMNLK